MGGSWLSREMEEIGSGQKEHRGLDREPSDRFGGQDNVAKKGEGSRRAVRGGGIACCAPPPGTLASRSLTVLHPGCA